MLFKVKETQKVYEISLKGWDGSAWSVDLSNDLLTDMDYQDGMEMSQKEFDEYVEWLEADVDRYVADIKEKLMELLNGNDVLHII